MDFQMPNSEAQDRNESQLGDQKDQRAISPIAEDKSSGTSSEVDPMDRSYMQPVEIGFESIKEFFDVMKKKPRGCDGLALEVLIRNVVNDEISGVRKKGMLSHDLLQKQSAQGVVEHAKLKDTAQKLKHLCKHIESVERADTSHIAR